MDAAQIVQIAGAAAILAAFAMSQFERQSADTYAYIALNVVGGALLLASALAEEQWGFMVLEAAWTAISLWALLRKVRSAGPAV